MTTTMTDLGGLSGTGAAATVTAPPSRWKSRVLLPGLVLFTVIALLLLTSAQALLPATPVRVVPVVVKTVEGASGTVTVQAPGWLEPDPHPHYVTALADGVVAEMLVLEGDRVERGGTVARLVDDDARLALQRAEAELRRQQSMLHAAQAELTAVRMDIDNLVERERAVAIGDATVAESQAETTKAAADTAVERARLAEVQDEHERKAKLTASQAVSEATVARLELRVDAQQAVVDAAVARQAVLGAKLDQARAELRAATRHRELLIDEHRAVALAEAGVGGAEAAVALAEAARDEAALRLRRMVIRTTMGGVVMQRLASPGSKLTLGGGEHASHIVHLYDPDHLQVRVDVPLADASHVAVGQRADITVEVLPDRTFTGSVTRLVHQADIQKNTVEVKVAVEDPSVELKPDMLARVRFIAESAPNGGTLRQRVFAPAALIRTDGADGATALVVTNLVDQRGRIDRRSIVTGPTRIDDWIEVTSGLQAGDLLVADPVDALAPGDHVRVVGEATRNGGG